MTLRTWSRAAVAFAFGLSLAACGSSSDDPEVPGPGEVFANSLAPGVDFQAFGGSVLTAASVDTANGHSGASWKVEVPLAADGWVGGTFVASTGHDLSTFNALTFWAKASAAVTLDNVGFGVDNTGVVPFITERASIALTTTWTRFVIPIPLASRLTAERGLFHYGDNSGGEGAAYTLWFDDIRYETLAASEIGTPVPAIATETRSLELDATLSVNGASVTYPSPGANQTLSVGRRYFDWSSSATDVASVDADGTVTGLTAGTAEITAALGAIDATGVTTVNVHEAGVPAAAAPTPTPLAADVISLFSNAYTDVTVDTWSAGWDAADLTELQIAGNDTKKYANLGYAGIEFTSATLDASAMTHFHVDLWSPTAGDTKMKLVDFGANGVWGDGGGGWPGDDVEHELTRTLTAEGWNPLEIPLSDFTGLTTRAHLAQLILSGANPTVYVDNVYFHK